MQRSSPQTQPCPGTRRLPSGSAPEFALSPDGADSSPETERTPSARRCPLTPGPVPVPPPPPALGAGGRGGGCTGLRVAEALRGRVGGCGFGRAARPPSASGSDRSRSPLRAELRLLASPGPSRRLPGLLHARTGFYRCPPPSLSLRRSSPRPLPCFSLRPLSLAPLPTYCQPCYPPVPRCPRPGAPGSFVPPASH